MFTRITLSRLEVYSVYKLIFIGLACSLIPLGVVFGVLALFGANTVNWNGQPLHGFVGLIASPFIGAFITLLFTVFVGTACTFGLWLFSKVKPLSLWGKSVVHHAEDVA
jgi:hypothetical protein